MALQSHVHTLPEGNELSQAALKLLSKEGERSVLLSPKLELEAASFEEVWMPCAVSVHTTSRFLSPVVLTTCPANVCHRKISNWSTCNHSD